MDRTSTFYSQPSYAGGGFPVFSGSRRQRGGSIFGALSRAVLPMLKTFGKKAATHVAKKALGLGQNVLFDTMKGVNPRQSLIKHGKQAAREVISDGSRFVLNTMNQLPRPTPSRKRVAPPPKTGPAKKRRKNFTATKKKSRANF